MFQDQAAGPRVQCDMSVIKLRTNNWTIIILGLLSSAHHSNCLATSCMNKMHAAHANARARCTAGLRHFVVPNEEHTRCLSPGRSGRRSMLESSYSHTGDTGEAFEADLFESENLAHYWQHERLVVALSAQMQPEFSQFFFE